MRIVIDAVAARRGGAGLTTIRELASAFPRLRPDNAFVFAVQRDLVPDVHAAGPGLRTITPPGGMQRPPLRLVWEHLVMPRNPTSQGADVVFSPFNVLPTRWSRPRPRLAVLVQNLAPYSPELREMYRGREGLRLRLLRRLTDRSLRQADRVYVVSPEAFRLIGPALLEGKTEVIPVAPPPEEGERLEPGEAYDEPFFLVTGDLFRYKGIELVIRAVASMPKDERPLVLVCGRPLDRPYAAQLRRFMDQLSTTDRVRMLGWVEHRRVLGLMRSARGCVVPSRFENMSHVPFEAMSRGAPVIASDIRSLRAACGDAALYFPLNDPGRLAEHLRTLLDDDSSRQRLADAGRAKVASMRPTDAAEALLRSFEALVS